MRKFLLSFLALACAVHAQDLAVDMTLHRLLIDGEGWQLVAENLGFADGPGTDAEGNFYFSDMKAPGIFKIALDGTKTLLLAEPASGLKFGPDGRLYACQGSKKRLIAIDLKTKTIDEIATDVNPNDLVVSHRGYIYFTETGKHRVTLVKPDGFVPKELVNSKTGEKSDISSVKYSKMMIGADVGITSPNGITLSPDQGTLAVSDTRGEFVWTFRIKEDGSLDAKAPYMTMRMPIDMKGEFKRTEPPPYLPASGGDGMTSDTTGRYFVASTLGVQVFDPTGRACGVLPKPNPAKPLTSCGFAGPDRAYLYVTNGDKIFRRKVQATGNIFFTPPGA